jgi:hypothetical protein
MRGIFVACCAWAGVQSAKSRVARAKATKLFFMFLLLPVASALAYLITLFAHDSALGGNRSILDLDSGFLLLFIG